MSGRTQPLINNSKGHLATPPMPHPDDESLTNFLDALADTAAKAIMPHFRASTEVTNKGAAHFDPVTAADRDAEAAKRRLIATTYPDHGIVGEEYGPERADAVSSGCSTRSTAPGPSSPGCRSGAR